MTLRYFNLEAFEATPLKRTPFDHVVVPDFVREPVRERIIADYPKIGDRGSYPVGLHLYGAAFRELLDELEGGEFRQAFEDKFDLDLSRRPTMTTVRGYCSAEDGKIHTDAENKILAVLIYLNPHWEAPGGRLRVLQSPDNLDDFVTEIQPTWNLLAFRRSSCSWHGHAPFEGPRRVLQMHWVTSQAYLRTQILRHHLTALVKRMIGSVSIAGWRIS